MGLYKDYNMCFDLSAIPIKLGGFIPLKVLSCSYSAQVIKNGDYWIISLHVN